MPKYEQDDFSALFFRRASKEPKEWGDAWCARVLGPRQQAALKTLAENGIMHLSRRDQPGDELFPRLRERCEFIVHFDEPEDKSLLSGEEYYYVDTWWGRKARKVYRIPTDMMRKILKGLKDG